MQLWGVKVLTYLLLVSWNPPSRSRIFAKRTAFRNGTSIISSRLSSTQNLYFFFFIIKAMPGALGPSKVINKFKMMPWYRELIDATEEASMVDLNSILLLHFCFPLQLFCSTAASETRKAKTTNGKLVVIAFYISFARALDYRRTITQHHEL